MVYRFVDLREGTGEVLGQKNIRTNDRLEVSTSSRIAVINAVGRWWFAVPHLELPPSLNLNHVRFTNTDESLSTGCMESANWGAVLLNFLFYALLFSPHSAANLLRANPQFSFLARMPVYRCITIFFVAVKSSASSR